MIKKYKQFIKENFKFGEWVEDLYNSDDYIKNIVNRYITDIDSDIRLANAINIQDERIQKEMKYYIDEYLKNGIEDKKPVISASIDIEDINESELNVAGKGIFTSFLKTLTALGQKEKLADFENCPEDFILFYFYQNMEAEIVKQIFNRFRSLSKYAETIDYGRNDVNMYFGIRCNGELEYGISYENRIPFGSFRLSSSVIKWLNSLESKSAFNIKKELVNLNYDNIITLGKIKMDMATYNPGDIEKRLNPKVSDKIISFGYQGVGNWDNGILDEGEFMTIKNNFINWLMSKKWASKVLISVKPSSHWIYIHIKLK